MYRASLFQFQYILSKGHKPRNFRLNKDLNLKEFQENVFLASEIIKSLKW